MAPLRVGFIGTGLKTNKPGPMGFGMAHAHAAAYGALPAGEVELAACCDLYRARAATFAEMYGMPAEAVYTDYHEMLAKERLDIVSVATWRTTPNSSPSWPSRSVRRSSSSES